MARARSAAAVRRNRRHSQSGVSARHIPRGRSPQLPLPRTKPSRACASCVQDAPAPSRSSRHRSAAAPAALPPRPESQRVFRTIAMEKPSNRSAPGSRPPEEIAGIRGTFDPPTAAHRGAAPAFAMPRGPLAAPARSTTQASDNEIAKGPSHTIPVRILGIETSCDETAAAVVKDGVTILSLVVASQIAHAKYGGVVPELASREHLRAIVPVVRLALEQATTDLDSMAAIAVTEGPGLVGSLLVGITYAKSLCFARDLPLI